MSQTVTAPTDAAARKARQDARLRKRHAAERRFRALGIASIIIALTFLGLLFTTIIGKGYTAFMQSHLTLEVYFDPAEIDPAGTRDPQALATANYIALARQSLQDLFPEATSRNDRRQMNALLSVGADLELRRMVEANPEIIGTTQRVVLPASADVDMVVKGHIGRDAVEGGRVSQQQLDWIAHLEAQDMLALQFNTRFFTAGDSREPELAGIKGAVMGSFYAMLVTVALSFPLGVATAIYLEEFAPKNRWTDLIEVNINNLAAVPSIVFGLLGLAVFLQFFNLPRSAPLVGGLVLTLMSLPTIIIASRAALKAVPPSIRQAATGLGASKLQVVLHHVLPLAMPGILTGTIIALAQALGETAPLLMIGMVAFVVDIPGGPFDPATALPVQIFLWADAPERAFVERTSAAIIVLLGFLAVMNIVAIILRKKFERRW
ncbi:phosphate ABC transporter permease PstA [Telmatospirillum sp. J64-1]|uniref:phosphate ABC transporter permease PstA n=1 Tax=Telmatospirillum sp. J64-1 TaxID=2502183 RepID=UPI00115EF3A5|nr:phosphate ABC transporter permease PstA [Telmatospirillum sp. J64-1]